MEMSFKGKCWFSKISSCNILRTVRNFRLIFSWFLNYYKVYNIYENEKKSILGGVTFFHFYVCIDMEWPIQEITREHVSHDVCITSLFTLICKIIATVVLCLETELVRFHMSLLEWLLYPDAAKVVWSKTHPIIENHMQCRQWEMILDYLIQQWDKTAATIFWIMAKVESLK